MNYKINLEMISSDHAEVQGTEMAIVNKEDNCVYITSKPYIDKLFSLMGYKNLSVIKILEEYAGKTISSIGNLDKYHLYVDKYTDSFVVADQISVDWVNAMIKFLEESQFTYKSIKRSDTFYYWDQLVVENRFGSKFVIYVDLCDEYVSVGSVSYDSDNVLTGYVNEGKFKFSDGQSSFDSFKLLISGKVDISSYYKLDEPLSVYEYVNLLKRLGYVGYTKKRKYYRKDESDEIINIVGNLDALLDFYNDMSWIQQRITKTPDNKNFYDACKLISINLDRFTIWSFRDIYQDNQFEQSDIFALNY